MQNTIETESRGVVAFQTKLEVIPSGRTVAVSELVQTKLLAGTPIGQDSNNLGHIIKCAEMQATATNTATDYKVLKGHNFKVGNHIMAATGAKAQTITAITTTNADYDTLTVGTSIGTEVLAGAHIYEATAANQSTGSAFKYTAMGLVGEDTDLVTGDNNLVSVVVRGTAIESNIPPIGSAIKSLLPLIRFV